MSPLEKIHDGFFEHLGTAAALVVTGLIGWLSLEIAPAVLPAIEKSVPTKVLLAILLLSAFLNIALAAAIAIIVRRLASKKTDLKLKYGILWDKEKNPHCPVCKNAGLHYNEWNYGELGYRCNSCNQVFGLKDATGKDIKPADAVKSL